MTRLRCMLFSLVGILAFSSLQLFAQQSAAKKCTVDKTPVSPADAALYIRDYGEAAKLYRQSLDHSPASAEAQAGLIRAMLGQNKLDESLAAARRLVDAQPQSAAAQTVLGETYLRRGEIDLAPPVLALAVKLDPCYGRGYYAEARMEFLSGMRATSARLLGVAHALSPLDDDIHVAWMWSLPSTQRYTELSAYVESTPYLNRSDREDLRSRITTSRTLLESSCTVSAPSAGTSLALHPGPEHGPDPGIATIDANLDGKTRRLTFNTAGSDVVILRTAAEHLGLKLDTLVSYDLTYEGGRVQYYVARVPSMRFGDIEFKNCMVRVVDTPYAESNTEGADGAVGVGFFSDFLVNINFPAETLKLTALPRLAVNEINGLPLWSTAAQQDHAEVPSRRGGDWALYDRTIPSEMKDWVRVYHNDGDLLLPTRVGAGHARLFYLGLNAPHPRIAATMTGETATLASMIRTPEKAAQIAKLTGSNHYFMEFGGLVLPVDAWSSVEFARYSIKTNLDVAGVISRNALKQLDITIDYRDQLIRFLRPTKTP